MAWRQSPGGSEQHLTLAAAAARTRTQRSGKHLAVHASELVVKPDFQILRRYRRPLLLRLEHTHRPTLEDYVHRATRLGSSRSLNLRIGIRNHRAPTQDHNRRQRAPRARSAPENAGPSRAVSFGAPVSLRSGGPRNISPSYTQQMRVSKTPPALAPSHPHARAGFSFWRMIRRLPKPNAAL